jgi:3-isopropylmalate/(R)-2-methylmalate dehydratase small subunit
MIIEGKVLKYGDNVDTDLILPGKYLTLTDPQELAAHAMEGLDSDFHVKIKEAGILVAGRNFGCGSSREHAPIALKYAGVKCILAESFARIFFRNAVYIGLPVLECQGISRQVLEGDFLTVNLGEGLVENKSRNVKLKAKPLPDFLLKILRLGGLMPYIDSQLKED